MESLLTLLMTLLTLLTAGGGEGQSGTPVASSSGRSVASTVGAASPQPRAVRPQVAPKSKPAVKAKPPVAAPRPPARAVKSPLRRPQASPQVKAPAKTPRPASSSVKFSDSIVGPLTNPERVACGGLWEQRVGGRRYLAREIACPGSSRYLSLKLHEKVSINGQVCSVVGAQNLNYNRHTLADIHWFADTVVQTCLPKGMRRQVGDVTLISLRCG